jgi:hypothetical protein
MKYIVRKAYWNYEKEEKWLNEMSAKGMALIDCSWCRYVFTDSEKGEYIYRIELLENLPSHIESVAYIRFLEETGVEFIASHMRWVYFRKKAVDGEFDLYSDSESKIRHFKRISMFWCIVAVVEFIAGGINLGAVILQAVNRIAVSQAPISEVNLMFGIICTLLGLVFAKLGLSVRRKIKRLKKEKEIRE